MARRILVGCFLSAVVLMLDSNGHAQAKKLQVLIITGSQQVHDWYNTTPILKRALEDTGRFEVAVTENPTQDLTPENLKKYQVLMLHYRETPATRPQRWPILDANYKPTGEFKEFAAMPG